MKAELLADTTLCSVRNSLLDISSACVPDFLSASSGTPARRELTDAFWEFDAFKPYALAAVKADPSLSKLSYKAVPKHTTESEFWRLYFVLAYAALAESMADAAQAHSPKGKTRRLSTMTSPKRLAPLSLPRGNSLFLRQEPWARVGGEILWLLSDESQHLLQGKLYGGAGLTEGPQPGVAAFAFTTPTAVFELGAPAALDASANDEASGPPSSSSGGTGEWAVCCWFLATEESTHGLRCLACADGTEQLVCLREGELGLHTGRTGFLSCGFPIGALANGWYHLAAVGLRGKTTFSLNGEAVGMVDAQCVAPLRFVGNTPQVFGTPSQPFGIVADVRAYCRAIDEAEIVALARMVPEANRPSVPTNEALRAFARKRAVELARQKLELAADMIASADVALGPSLVPSVRRSYDLGAMREQLLLLSSAMDGDAAQR